MRGYFLQQGAFLRDDSYKASELKNYYILRQNYLNKRYKLLLPPFQIIRHFGFSRCIAFAMHLDIRYVLIHNKSCLSRKAKTTYKLQRREYMFSVEKSAY